MDGNTPIMSAIENKKIEEERIVQKESESLSGSKVITIFIPSLYGITKQLHILVEIYLGKYFPLHRPTNSKGDNDRNNK